MTSDAYYPKYQTDRIDMEVLYEILEKIGELQLQIAERKELSFGDDYICRLNRLMDSLPQTISRGDLVAYDGMIRKKVEEKTREGIEADVIEKMREFTRQLFS